MKTRLHFKPVVGRVSCIAEERPIRPSVTLKNLLDSLRFIAVTQPIKYARHKNSKRVHVMLALTWVVSLAISSPIALGQNYTDRRSQTPLLCIFYNSDFLIYSSMGSFYIPCIVMILLYSRVFVAIRARAKRVSQQKKAPTSTAAVVEAGGGVIGGAPSAAAAKPTGNCVAVGRGTTMGSVGPTSMAHMTSAKEGSAQIGKQISESSKPAVTANTSSAAAVSAAGCDVCSTLPPARRQSKVLLNRDNFIEPTTTKTMTTKTTAADVVLQQDKAQSTQPEVFLSTKAVVDATAVKLKTFSNNGGLTSDDTEPEAGGPAAGGYLTDRSTTDCDARLPMTTTTAAVVSGSDWPTTSNDDDDDDANSDDRRRYRAPISIDVIAIDTKTRDVIDVGGFEMRNTVATSGESDVNASANHTVPAAVVKSPSPPPLKITIAAIPPTTMSTAEKTKTASHHKTSSLPPTKGEIGSSQRATAAVAELSPSAKAVVASRFNFHLPRPNRTSKKKSNAGSNRRERKATKTLAIVLGLFPNLLNRVFF